MSTKTKMRKRRSRMISVILIVAMCCTAFATAPLTASADPDPDPFTVISPADLNNMPVTGALKLEFAEEINRMEPIVFQDSNGFDLVQSWELDNKTVSLDYTGAGFSYVDDIKIDYSVWTNAGTNLTGTIKGKIEADTTKPTIDDVSIINYAKNVLVKGDIVITFSEAMDTRYGEIYLNGERIYGGSWEPDERKVFTIPYEGLSFYSAYRLEIKGFMDPSGNKIDEKEIFFTTLQDNVPPVADPIPADQSKNVPVKGNIIIVFDEAMEENAGKVVLDGQELTGGSWSQGGKVYTVAYDGLAYETLYSYELIGFRDKFSNKMDAVTIQFGTDIKRPECTTAPADGEVNVSVSGDIVLTFDEEMDDTVKGLVTLDGAPLPFGGWSQNYTVYTIPNADLGLVLDCEYEIEISGFTGVNGIVINNKSFVFTTEALPVVVTTTPEDGAVDAPVAGDLVIAFDKVMGAAGVVRMNGEEMSGGQWDSTGMNYVIPYSGLEYVRNYRVVCSGFKDASGFEMDGREVFKFTTMAKPVVKAKVISVKPVTDATVKGTLEIKFDKSMNVDNGAIQLNGKTLRGTWADSVTLLVAYDGLENSKSYEVKLVDFIDADGNAIDPYVATMTTAKKAETSVVTSCTVTFDSNGGDPVTLALTGKTGEAYGKLPATKRTGYTFTGWFTKRDGTIAVTETTILTQQADHTLYAGWKANTYTVKFDVNKGEAIKTRSKKVTFGAKVGAMPVPAPRRLGNIFRGWYTAKTGGKKVTAASVYSKTGDTTLYARWTIMYNRGQARKNVARVPILSKPSTKNGKVLGYYKKGVEFVIIKRHMRPNNTCDFLQVKYKGKAAWVRSSQVVAYKIYPKQ